MGKPGDPLEEYKDLSENMRHYANMRFALLTVFSALSAGLLTLWWGTERNPCNKWGFVIFAAAGLVITSTSWVMEERAADYWNHFRERAKTLEKKLGYCQYASPPRMYLVRKLGEKLGVELEGKPIVKSLTATNATRVLYVLANFFWLIEFIQAVSQILRR